jgi:Peptidase family M23
MPALRKPEIAEGRRLGGVTAGAAPRRDAGREERACLRAPGGYWYGNTRPGVESGSKLPHSTETWRRLIWRAAAACILILWLFGFNGAGFAGERITPVLLSVQDAPMRFMGSDGRTHLVYELWMTNFSSGKVSVEQVEILGEGGVVLQTMDSSEVARRLQPAGFREPSGVMSASTDAILFVHVILADGQTVPQQLVHRVRMRAEAAPPGQQELTETGGETAVDTQPVVVIGPPLRGERYISADSCCDASRHTRAALPVNGRVWLAQRFAVDWEQLDEEGRVYRGAGTDVASYNIYGKDVLAVADAKVASVIDNLPNQVPGQMPVNISVEEADGNSIVLDLSGGRYALYAHLKPGSIRVHTGDTVKRGETIALVGNSGNTLEPHLHFHVMNHASALASNGLPYEIDSFTVTAKSPGTEGFDTAAAKGTPLAITPLTPVRQVTNGLPLDQLIISFGR